MSARDKIFNALINNRDDYISGGQMAADFGISRNAVWKNVKSLQEQGYVIEAVTNKGYRLVKCPDILSPELIKKELNPALSGPDIEVRAEVTSTNTVLKETASLHPDKDYLLVAGRQTMGRGRLGRKFYSPDGDGVYFSLLLHPKLTGAESQYLTTAIAAAVAKAIEKVCGFNAVIKWVNDIFVNGKKVCGILTEAVIDFETAGLEYAIVGTGINITTPKDGYPDEIKDVAGALYEHGKAIPGVRNSLVAATINYFYEYYEKLAEKPFLEEYKKRSFLIGERVKVIGNIAAPDDYYEARVLDIDNDLRLVIETPDGGIKTLMTGEVSIRKI